MIFTWFVLICSIHPWTLCESHIICYSCLLGSLINYVAFWFVCAWNKQQQSWKKCLNNRLSILKKFLRCSRKRKPETAEWWMKVYCLMSLVWELHLLVHLSGIAFTNFNPFQPQPVHEKKMATLITLSSLHFAVIKWNRKALLKVQKAV